LAKELVMISKGIVLDGQIDTHTNKAFFGGESDKQDKDLETMEMLGGQHLL
jgi:hypothetical protein